MIVVALKTAFLISIMSWYSLAIFSMINDYFRKEFNEYIKHDPVDGSKSNAIQHVVSMPSNKLDMAQVSQISAENAIKQQPDQFNRNQPNGIVTIQQHQHIEIVKYVIHSDSSRCLLDDYIVQIFLRNPVCPLAIL